MKQGLVIYHANCIDGFTSAWAAWLRYGNDAEYLPASYGDVAPDVTGRSVLVVDFSYPRDVMVAMNDQAESLAVLDHHKTAQAALDGLAFATFDMDRSGAGITWDVLHAGVRRPWLIDYVEDRDLWRWKLPNSKEANAWIGACLRDSFKEWSGLRDEGLERAVENGSAVLAYIDRYVHEMVAQARRVTFEGHNVPIVNAPYIGISELLNALCQDEPFAIGWSQRSDGLYAYSLRSSGPDAIDVSAIAKKFGGGGHKNSAGFIRTRRFEEP